MARGAPSTRIGGRTLSAARIVAEAIGILDEGGADQLSIRTLATRLDAGPMTLYNYFPTKTAILESVIDEIIEPIGSPRPGRPDWVDELGDYGRRSWRALSPHPWVADFLARHEIPERPQQAESRRLLHQLFREAGADHETSSSAVAAFYAFVIGSVAQLRPRPDARTRARRDAQFEVGLSMLLDGTARRIRGAAADDT